MRRNSHFATRHFFALRLNPRQIASFGIGFGPMLFEPDAAQTTFILVPAFLD